MTEQHSYALQDPDGNNLAPKRRTRGPNKPKPLLKVQVVDGPEVGEVEAEQAREDAAFLARAKRTFEEFYPFLDVEMSIQDRSLFAVASFGNLQVEAKAGDAKRLAYDLKEWARYQLWQKERIDEMRAWYKQDPDREEWLELSTRPVSSPGPRKGKQ